MTTVDTDALRRFAAELALIRDELVPPPEQGFQVGPAGIPELDAACSALCEAVNAVALAQARRMDALSAAAAAAAAHWDAAERAVAGAIR